MTLEYFSPVPPEAGLSCRARSVRRRKRRQIERVDLSGLQRQIGAGAEAQRNNGTPREQAIGAVSLSSAAVKTWLDENRVDVSKVRIVEIPFPQMGGAPERGAVAAALITEPALSAAASEVRACGRPYDSIAKQFISGYWFTTREWLTANPDAAKRFVGAIYDRAFGRTRIKASRCAFS